MRGMAILPHGLEEERGMTMSDDADSYLMAALDEELKAAAKEHPDFADSIHYGAGVIGMKYGELYQALGKSLREDSTRDEALDLLCVAWLFYRGYWKKKEE